MATAAALLVSVPVAAHHSFSAYNRSEAAKKTIRGVVRQFSLINPHGAVKVAVPGAGGKSEIWSFELSSATQLQNQGWKTDSVKVGETIDIVYFPLRFGSNGGLLYSIRTSGGQLLVGTAEADRGYPKPKQGAPK